MGRVVGEHLSAELPASQGAFTPVHHLVLEVPLGGERLSFLILCETQRGCCLTSHTTLISLRLSRTRLVSCCVPVRDRLLGHCADRAYFVYPFREGMFLSLLIHFVLLSLNIKFAVLTTLNRQLSSIECTPVWPPPPAAIPVGRGIFNLAVFLKPPLEKLFLCSQNFWH